MATNTARLGDLISVTRGTTYKSVLLGQPGPVLLGLASIARNGGFRSDSLRTYGGESPDKLLVRPGELFASLKDVTQSADLLGSVARVPIAGPTGRLTQDTVRIDVTSNDVIVDYLYLALLTPQYRQYCRSRATGTTNLGLPRRDFLAYEIPLPSRSEQRRIASVLGVFDNLIETNLANARLAEELWRTVLTAAIADVSERTALSSLAQFVNGRNFTKDASGTGLPVIRTPEVRTGPSPSTIRNDVEATNDRIANAGDILFVWSGSLMVSRWYWEPGLVNQHVFKVLPERSVPDWLVMFAVEELMNDFLGVAADKATTMGHIKRGDLDRQVTIPPRSEWARLDEKIRPFWDEALASRQYVAELTRTRDELLPLLLSGKVSIDESFEVA
jgi:type I restriction enzyme S subunit